MRKHLSPPHTLTDLRFAMHQLIMELSFMLASSMFHTHRVGFSPLPRTQYSVSHIRTRSWTLLW